jgi:hypothetical protein
MLKIAEARPPQLLGAEREPGFLCPGRQTDPTRQNVIREFVSHRLKATGQLGDGGRNPSRLVASSRADCGTYFTVKTQLNSLGDRY